MDIQSLAGLSDSDLLARVKALAHGERRATVALVAHLAEFENRKLYLGEACASLFAYCTRVLHLSEHAAYNRIEAARAARRFPAVLAGLEQGLLHLTAVRLLAPVLTAENHRDLLAAAKHKSKREVEEILARLRPQPDVPARVRKLPAAKPLQSAGKPTMNASTPSTSRPGNERVSGAAFSSLLQPASAVSTTSAGPAATPSSPPRPAVVVPLAPERYRVQFTVSAATREKLRRAQELLRHQIPTGDVSEVVDLALDLLVCDLEKKKFANLSRPRRQERGVAGVRPDRAAVPSVSQPQPQPRPSPPSQGSLRSSRYIPPGVKRAVWERDQGRCAFVAANGDQCGERGALEFDHIRPHADGGGATVDNVRLLCRSHNQYEAQQFFGSWQSDGMRESAPRWG